MGVQICNFRPSDNNEWHRYSACLGADMYPSDGDEQGIEDCRAICQTCPVLTECLISALDRGERYGVWGGTSPDERQEMRRNTMRKGRRSSAPADFSGAAETTVAVLLDGIL